MTGMQGLEVEEPSRVDLDAVLKELGDFGKYQVYVFLLIMFPMMTAGFSSMEYIFITMDIPHRCRVPECELASGTVKFAPEWLRHAVPFTDNDEPEQCQRFQPLYQHNGTDCPPSVFSNVTVKCHDWVFEEPTRTVIHDFNLMCPADEWDRLDMSSQAMFSAIIGVPLAGFICDRIGRKPVILVGSTMGSLVSVICSFSTDYDMFMRCQLVLGLFMGCIYIPSLCYALEMLPANKRLLGSLLINIFFTMGEVLLGLAMWWVQDWRLLIRILHIPMLGLVSFFWLMPESVRWLHARKSYKRVHVILTNIAEMNGTYDKLPHIIDRLKAEDEDKEPMSLQTCTSHVNHINYIQLIKSKTLMFRFISCCICCLMGLFTYYGITQDSVSIGGNRYVNFIVTSLVEVPAYLVSLWLPGMECMGRRLATITSYFTSAAALAFFCIISPEQEWWHDLLFLGSKFCATLSTVLIYLYTAELFPTEIRSSVLTCCTFVGHAGQLFVTHISLVDDYINPMLVYSLASVVGGLLALTCPETLNLKLPDTVADAEAIGQT